MLEPTIEDLDNGSYLVTYQVDEVSTAHLDIQLFNDGLEVPLRGNPFQVNFEENTTKNWNSLTGPFMDKHIKSQLENMKGFIDTKSEGCKLTEEKDVEHNVKNLIAVKDNVTEVQSRHDQTILDLDQLEESLQMFHREGLAKDS